MARETWVQSQVESYQRLEKWYLMLPCLTLSIIRLGSRVKWSNLGKGIAPSPTPQCSSYRKGSLLFALDYGRQLYFYLYIAKYSLVQSAGVVEYTDCFSAEGPDTPPTSVLHMILKNLMVRFQYCWSFGECRVHLHCHRSHVHSGAGW